MAAGSSGNERSLIAELLANAFQDLGLSKTADNEVFDERAHASVTAGDLLPEAELKSLVKRLDKTLVTSMVRVPCRTHEDSGSAWIPSPQSQPGRANADISNGWDVALEEWDE